MTDPDDLWLEPPQPQAETSTELRPATGYASPFVSITPTGGLTQAPPTPPGILAVTAAHGGAGATTWAHLLGGVDVGQQWPGPSLQPTNTLLVARASLTGLTAAQRAGLQWAAGVVPSVSLIGVLLAPDIPGRLPKELRELERKVRAIFPVTIDAPFVNEWRTTTAEEATTNNKIAAIITEITGKS